MAEWSLADEQQLQALLARKVFVSQNEGTMADSSKRRHDGSPTGGSETPWIEIADAVPYPEPQSSTEGLEVKALLPTGVSSLAMWGRTKFAFGKFEKEKKNYKTVFDEDPGYVAWCRKHLTEFTAKGPALDWSRYIKVRDLTSGKGKAPCYSGTTQEREFCD